MRQWLPSSSQTAPGRQVLHSPASQTLASMVHRLGDNGFAPGLLEDLEPVLPAASWSVYRTGHRCKPTLFMSASQGVPDTTQDCWWAYLAGPYRSDRTWGRMFDDIHVIVPETRLCHVTAKEVDGEHRARVYEAHGMAERVSVVEYESTGSVFAVNFYRHQHQLPFSDRQIGEFESVAPVLLELARKHILLSRPGAHGPGTAGLASTVLSAPAPAPHYGPPRHPGRLAGPPAAHPGRPDRPRAGRVRPAATGHDARRSRRRPGPGSAHRQNLP